MREPIERHATSFGLTTSLSGQGRKLSLTRQVLTALGFTTAMACMPLSFAQETEVPSTEPAMETELAHRALLLDVAQAGDRLVAVGGRGHVIYSDDLGQSWTQAQSPVRQVLTAVYFVDENHGWAVGHDSLILHSSDAGESWELQYRDPALDQPVDEFGLLEKPLMDVWFRDTQTGFAMGGYGLFLRTDDGGQTWEDLTDEIDNDFGFHYSAITEVKDTGLFLVAEMGAMFRSFDFGDTWEALPEEDQPYEGSLFGVVGTDKPGEILTWGLRGNMFRSTDFGDSWEQVELITPNNGPLEATLLGGHKSTDGRLVVTGLGGTVVTSLDGGETFQIMTRPDRANLAAGRPLPDGSFLLLGQRGSVRMDSVVMPDVLP
ncbi:MAG: hypothetical protein EA348_01355 [Pseudomonadaceae bacterium]|nr:MAG: hypothetical protein EA348_01355 [Pseudomonadaceae bacterium]